MAGRPSTLTGTITPTPTGGTPPLAFGGAWLIAAVVVIVGATMKRPIPDAVKYTLWSIILLLLVQHSDRWANPINRFARNLGGTLS